MPVQNSARLHASGARAMPHDTKNNNNHNNNTRHFAPPSTSTTNKRASLPAAPSSRHHPPPPPPSCHQRHKRHRSAASQPAVPTVAMARRRRPSYPASLSSMSSDESAMTNDLYSLIDDHLAWQHDARRPGSAGTVFVDWDGYGQPQVSYRAEVMYREEAAERWARGMPAWGVDARGGGGGGGGCRRADSRARRMSLQDDRYAARPMSRQLQHQHHQFQPPPFQHGYHHQRRMSLEADRYAARPSSARQHQQLFFQPRPPVPARSPHRKQIPARPGSSRGGAGAMVPFGPAPRPSSSRAMVPFGPAPRPSSSRNSMVQFAEARPASSRGGMGSPFASPRPGSSGGWHAPKSTRSLYVAGYDDSESASECDSECDSDGDNDGYGYDTRVVHVPQRPATRQSYVAPPRSCSSASESEAGEQYYELDAGQAVVCAREVPAYDTLTPVIVIGGGGGDGSVGLGDSEKTPVIVNEGFETPITIIGNVEKALPGLPEEGLKKRVKVKGFVRVVLGRLEGRFAREH